MPESNSACSPRNRQIDILKGIAIIMMVWGHCGLPGTSYVYLFHMAVFVIASGYFYRRKEDMSLWDGILHKIRVLYVPYVIINVGFTLFFYLIQFVPVSLPEVSYYENGLSAGELLRLLVMEVLMLKAGPWEGQTWFLRTLFHVAVLFLMADRITDRWAKSKQMRIAVHIGIGSILLAGGYTMAICMPQTPIMYNMERTMMSYILYVAGWIFGQVICWQECGDEIHRTEAIMHRSRESI